MIAISEWLPPLAASLAFLALGLRKVYGWPTGGDSVEAESPRFADFRDAVPVGAKSSASAL